MNAASPPLWPFVVYLLGVVGLVVVMLVAAWLLGGRHRPGRGDDPFESGVVSTSSAQVRLSVDFYLVAIFFVIFDLETVFIFAWAVAFYELGWAGYVAVLIFIAELVVALVYAWRSGALDWGKRRQSRQPRLEHS